MSSDQRLAEISVGKVQVLVGDSKAELEFLVGEFEVRGTGKRRTVAAVGAHKRGLSVKDNVLYHRSFTSTIGFIIRGDISKIIEGGKSHFIENYSSQSNLKAQTSLTTDEDEHIELKPHEVSGQRENELVFFEKDHLGAQNSASTYTTAGTLKAKAVLKNGDGLFEWPLLRILPSEISEEQFDNLIVELFNLHECFVGVAESTVGIGTGKTRASKILRLCHQLEALRIHSAGRLQKKYRQVGLERVRRVDAKVIREMISAEPGSRINELFYGRTPNIFENRAIKAECTELLRRITDHHKVCSTQFSSPRKSSTPGTVSAYLEELGYAVNRLRKELDHSWYRDVPLRKERLRKTPLVTQDHYYAQVFKTLREIGDDSYLLDSDFKVVNQQVRKLSALYELWCFYKMLKRLLDLDFVLKKNRESSRQGIREVLNEKFNIVTGAESVYFPSDSMGIKLELSKQLSNDNSQPQKHLELILSYDCEDEGLGAIKGKKRPDFKLEYYLSEVSESGGFEEPEEKSKHYIAYADAKFKSFYAGNAASGKDNLFEMVGDIGLKYSQHFKENYKDENYANVGCFIIQPGKKVLEDGRIANRRLQEVNAWFGGAALKTWEAPAYRKSKTKKHSHTQPKSKKVGVDMDAARRINENQLKKFDSAYRFGAVVLAPKSGEGNDFYQTDECINTLLNLWFQYFPYRTEKITTSNYGFCPNCGSINPKKVTPIDHNLESWEFWQCSAEDCGNRWGFGQCDAEGSYGIKCEEVKIVINEKLSYASRKNNEGNGNDTSRVRLSACCPDCGKEHYAVFP